MIRNHFHVAMFHEFIFNFSLIFYVKSVRNFVSSIFQPLTLLTISLLFTAKTFYETANKGELNKMRGKRRNKKFQRTKKA